MNILFPPVRRTAYPIRWAVYRNGEKVSSREGYLSLSEAKKVAKALQQEFPAAEWASGNYRDDTGTAPMLLTSCLIQKPLV